MSASELGTLMWIGAREGEFEQPYQFCLANAAQLALRENCEQALQRRAAGVRGIVVARNDRTPISAHSLNRLHKRYSAAAVIHVLGALADGMRSDETLPADQRLPWHRWNEVLPKWLEQWGAAEQELIQRSPSVAIVASHFQAAAPLIELAMSTGATTVWIQSPHGARATNFDAVWWDDSVAPAASSDKWRERIEQFSASGIEAIHHWVVGIARPEDHAAAHQAGIARIVTKPYRIERLLETLQQPGSNSLRVAA